jgi:predicted DNA-binding transcriptional regulator AlpA
MSDDDGFFSKKTIRHVVPISMTQIDRLESRGKFPRRVILSGNARNSKVGWVKKEVLAWCLMKAAQRQSGSTSE